MSILQADLHVSSRPSINVPPRQGRQWLWSGLANTLIHSDKFALLVDTAITITQNKELIRWINDTLGPNRVLTHVFITHGHKDHYLGLATLRDAFPDLKVIATQGTIQQKQIHDDLTAELWPALFPNDQLDLRNDWTIDALPSDGRFDIAGTQFQAFGVTHGDCANASFLHIPELEMVCAGDIVIATHLYFGEAKTTEARRHWLKALDAIESLKPQVVIPGHMRPGQIPSARFMIEDTRRYIRTWEEELAKSKNPEEMFTNMKVRYPSRFGDFVLQSGADEAFSSAS
jgi:glyoxylase-like metal-dependent hydrolase (beta-lactamase superfamily II)